MKKIIAISVMFALVAGAVFAQAAVSGSVETRWFILEGNSEDDNGPYTSGGIASGALAVAGANDANTFGAVLKMVFKNPSDPDAGWGEDSDGRNHLSGAWFDRAFVWWNPIDQLKFRIGHDGDGQFNTANLIRWGHHQMPRGVSVESWNQHQYLLGNWDHFAFTASILPVENFDINLAIGLNNDGRELGDLFNNFLAQAGYNIPDVGKITFTFVKASWWPYAATWNPETDGGKVGLTFFSNSLAEGLAFELGGNYDLTSTDDRDQGDQLKFAAGVHYASGDFGLKFRFWGGPRGKDDTVFLFTADIMPFYNISDTVGTFYCNIRFEQTGKDLLGWHLNPYLRNRMGGGHDFRVGLLIGGVAGDAAPDNAGIDFKLATSWVFGF
jgi:hypothetical protein